MAILKHPDKNRNNPNAAAEFDELKKAYELLTDDQAKGAYDDLIRCVGPSCARAEAFTL
jgi:DnaJ family protein C protein 17